MKKMSVIANRAIALYHLRVNPKNVKWIRGRLLDEEGSRCALGLIAEAFNIEISRSDDFLKPNGEIDYIAYRDWHKENDPYKKLQEILGLDRVEGIDKIYGANDSLPCDIGNEAFGIVANTVEDVFERFPVSDVMDEDE